MTTTTTTLTVAGLGSVPVTFTDSGTGGPGSGRPVLLLHGGAGPFSVAGFAELLSSSEPPASSLRCTPASTAPPRPEQLASIASLAAVYAQLLRDLGLTDVCVVGNSIGGWIAAELALAESAAPDHRVSSVVLVDAAGLAIDGGPDTGLLLADPGPGLRPQPTSTRTSSGSTRRRCRRAPGGAGGEQSSAARVRRAPRWQTPPCWPAARPFASRPWWSGARPTA